MTKTSNMEQFNKHPSQYQIREKITYPETLYIKLNGLCKKRDNALDIACGNGISSSHLLPYFKNIEAVDFDDNLIQLGLNRYPQIKFHLSKAELYIDTTKKFDLITCATAFYWLDRLKVLQNIQRMIQIDGIFCAYKYDFPIFLGKLNDFINSELVNKWQIHRDKRLTAYDDTAEIMKSSMIFRKVSTFVENNVIQLTTEEIALFFLSTSYVTRYIEATGDTEYAKYLVRKCCQIGGLEKIEVRFDIYGYLCQGLAI